MLVWRAEDLLLIERKKAPAGFAPPAGHVDDDSSFEEAAKRELREEVGLDAQGIKLLIEGRKENLCRREDGKWHYWKIYQVKTSGEIKRNIDETKQVNFYTKNDLLSLAGKTRKYLYGDTKQDDWEESPGLEPVWYEWLTELKII